MTYLDDVFGPQGLFAARFPGYKPRPGQVEVARAVDQAIRTGRHLLGEAPCGTGKSLAYGVPAVYHAHHEAKTVVIATANIALQDQLVKKDLPLLAELLPWRFSYALLKGRSNYLCLDRLASCEVQRHLAGALDHRDRTHAILEWAQVTTNGDVATLPFVPDPKLWSRFSVGADECKGDDCAFRSRCFAEKAKNRAAGAQILVTNFHLLFAHLALRKKTGQDLVLPPFDSLILDEAHEAEDIAREFFGFQVSEFSVRALTSFAAQIGRQNLREDLARDASLFFRGLAAHAASPAYKSRLKTPGVADPAPLLASLHQIAAEARAVAENPKAADEVRSDAKSARRTADLLTSRIRDATELSDKNFVYFIELDRNERAVLRAKPIDVSLILRDELFERTRSVSLISATLTTAGTFSYIRRQLGVPKSATELVARSPFDFEKQALLILPDGIPDPRDPQFGEAAAGAFARVVSICGGRTLGLFTSYRQMNEVYERVPKAPHRVMRQGEAPRAELLRAFREDVSSVLLATESFWTGIDVPGEALTALVIDKLPFPITDDPLVDVLWERDPHAFDHYLLPRTIIMLRQGVGRLIRSTSDVGVVVLLDPRILSKPYGHSVLRSLPPMQRTRDLARIAPFLEEALHALAA